MIDLWEAQNFQRGNMECTFWCDRDLCLGRRCFYCYTRKESSGFCIPHFPYLSGTCLTCRWNNSTNGRGWFVMENWCGILRLDDRYNSGFSRDWCLSMDLREGGLYWSSANYQQARQSHIAGSIFNISVYASQKASFMNLKFRISSTFISFQYPTYPLLICCFTKIQVVTWGSCQSDVNLRHRYSIIPCLKPRHYQTVWVKSM